MSKTTIISQLTIVQAALKQANRDLKENDLKSLYEQLKIISNAINKSKIETVELVFDYYDAVTKENNIEIRDEDDNVDEETNDEVPF